MLALAAFVLLQAAPADAGIQTLIDQLGAEKIEIRAQALRQLLRIGSRALPLLEKAAQDSDREVAERARTLVQNISIREHVSGTLLDNVPGLEPRLLQGDWLPCFLELASDLRQPAGRRRYSGVTGDELATMAPMVIRRAASESERVNVCQYVGWLALKTAVPHLLDYLKDERAGVRMAVVAAVRDADARDQVAALRPCLEDKDPRTRSIAAYTLGLFGDKESIPALRKLLRDESSDLRWWAIRALGDLDAVEAVDDVQRLTADPDPAIRRAATSTLPKLQRKP